MKKSKEQFIKEVLDGFDFDMVHRAMKNFNWEYAFDSGCHVPTTSQLIELAKDLLNYTFDISERSKADCETASGGFRVLAYYNTELEHVDVLRLVFELVSSDSF